PTTGSCARMATDKLRRRLAERVSFMRTILRFRGETDGPGAFYWGIEPPHFTCGVPVRSTEWLRLAESCPAPWVQPAARTVRRLMTRFTPSVVSAIRSASVFAVAVSTVPRSVTTPLDTSTLIFRAGVSAFPISFDVILV